METIETIVRGSVCAEIVPDMHSTAPNEWANDQVFLVADHRDFYVASPKGSTFESVVDDYQKSHHVFGLEAYIHSGVVLALSKEGNFPDRQWDVSQLGAVFVSKEMSRTKKGARKYALNLIEQWNMYLSGDVYGVVVRREGDEEWIDSTFGYYGIDDAKSAAQDMLDAAYDSEKKRQLAKKRAEIINHVPLEKRTTTTL